MTEKQDVKKPPKALIFWIVVFILFAFIYYTKDTEYNTTSTQQIREYATMQDAYNSHKNYIWSVCKKWLNLISPEASNFDGPTYAGEYQDKFIVKGTSDGNIFRCEFIKADNERGLNLNDVKREL